MGHFLVERYLPVSSQRLAAGDAERLARTAGAELLLTLYCREEETCFHLFNARCAVQVERAGAAAGVELDRITPVVRIGADTSATRVGRSGEGSS